MKVATHYFQWCQTSGWTVLDRADFFQQVSVDDRVAHVRGEVPEFAVVEARASELIVDPSD